MSDPATWRLRVLGVGSAAAPELGSASVALERDSLPFLMIDCGQEALSAWLACYRQPPPALFLTHLHFDHVAGLERLFGLNRFDRADRPETRLYVPAGLVPLLQERVAGYPNVLAEGGANFWDALRLVPVGEGFWHDGRWFDVFPVRHHAPGTAFGLCLRAAFLFTGDTRPIPEVLETYADGRMPLLHDCGLEGNPSHTGLDDLLHEYPDALRRQLLLYHYGGQAEGDALQAAGFRVARPGEVLDLPAPLPADQAKAMSIARRLRPDR